MNNIGMVRVAAVVPRLKVGDISGNTEEIIRLAREAFEKKALFVVFPELCITGYTLADLFHQELVQARSLEALQIIARELKNEVGIITIGLPVATDGKVFNVAAVIGNGTILGIIPKSYIPGYKEFYEKRWFAPAKDLISKEIRIGNHLIPIGTDILFQSSEDARLTIGIEICEDLWGPLPPSSFQAIAGATIIANLSASNELVGKASYRRELVTGQSARTISGYIYSSCGVHESTTDLVFSGHSLIAENGTLISETGRFERESNIIYGDIDIAHCIEDRIRTTSFGDTAIEIKERPFRKVEISLPIGTADSRPLRPLAATPFLPSGNPEAGKRVAEDIFSIQASGLAKRLEYIGIQNVLLGLSGGLDSTLAFLVALDAFKKLSLAEEGIRVITMPGFGTTEGTRSNAHLLAEAAGIGIEEISIADGAVQQFKDIGHDGETQDITYENVQARYRTMILMNKANQTGSIVIGTGDLSEIALGWSTFTGDHISHYNVNAGVPKTLVRHIVGWYTENHAEPRMREVLKAILDTPISPELTKSKEGEIAQKTEEIIGPYELHDFFLYHFVRWGSDPKKILFLARYAFEGTYDEATIKKWLRLFIKRFFTNQWKRSVMPDGPKIGSVALSPRGDWRMPSDTDISLWMAELE